MTFAYAVRAAVLALGLSAACASLGLAQGASVDLGVSQYDSGAPVEITSESLELNQSEGVATFTGNVFVRQGGITLTCDRMIVEYGRDDSTGQDEIRTIRMFGKVTFASDREAAEADSAVYSLAGESLVMTGNVLVTQGPTALSSDRLTYNLASGQGVMEGNVKTILNQAGN
ncbi:MAG: lipopolysaccharide transport periplasmic protein LptA [Pseudomonadota bacterium]